MNKITSKIVGLATIASIVFGSTSVALASSFSIGTRGQEVSDLQIKLIEAGYDIPAISKGGVSTGYYGVQTQQAENAYNANQNGSAIVGSVTSPDIYQNYLSLNGYREEFRRTPIRPATTTPCDILSPVSTSTLAIATLQLTTSTTSAMTWVIAKSATSYATTTTLGTFTVASGANVSTTTTFANDGSFLFAPSQHVVFGVAGLSANSLPGAALVGQCQAKFTVL